MGQRRSKLGLAMVLALAGAGCSLLVDFVDQESSACPDGGCLDATLGPPDVGMVIPFVDAGGLDVAPDVDPCATLADGAPCGQAGPCTLKPTCVGGRCTPSPREAGVFCSYGGKCMCNYCNGEGACSDQRPCPEAFNWDASDPLARCCAGQQVLTNNNQNCGVCGITCDAVHGESCGLLDKNYQCNMCNSNTYCWSGCCAVTTTPHHCSESDCNNGNCVEGLCPAPSHCVQEAGRINHCAY